MRSKKKDAVIYFAVYSFIFLTVCFFAPMEVYLGNYIDFSFSVRHIWWILLVFSLVCAAVLALLCSLLPEKLSSVIQTALFAVGLCFYVQSLLLNGKMISLTGDEAGYSAATCAINIIIWLVLATAVFAARADCAKKAKSAGFSKVIALLSLACIVMQMSGCVSLCFSTDFAANDRKNAYFTSEGAFSLSAKNNVLYFILDTSDGDYVNEALAQDPDLFGGLDGFTYYPNATSAYSRTYPSITYLLTQNRCYFNKPYYDYVNDSFAGSAFWRDLASLCDDLRIYTTSNYVGSSAFFDMDNFYVFDSSKLSALDIGGVIRASADVGMYRAAPYIIKESFKYDAAYIDGSCLKPLPNGTYYMNDNIFYDDLMNCGIDIDRGSSSTFRFFHLWGAHPGCFIDENAQLADAPTPAQALRGDFKILKEYFAQMKTQGIYDSSTIIITADHGKSGGGNELDPPKTAACLMLVKPAGADSSRACVTSDAPVSHDDLFSTVIAALGGDGGAYGTPVYDIPEDSPRERLYYYSSLYSDIDGEIALREVCVNGDAAAPESWALTGRNWDINYSENRVSDKRLSTEEPGAQVLPAPVA